MFRKTCALPAAFASVALVAILVSNGAAAQPRPAERSVMAFYYPWYGTAEGPGGAGRTVHWGQIDAAHKDIAASTHYPALGAYDSHDPNVIDQHCTWARAAGVDTLIVSWWGHGDYTDRAMNAILDACARHELRACIYYETVPRPQTPQSAAEDIVKVLRRYGGHEAYLKANGHPVVFIYGRAVNELGLIGWRQALQTIKAQYAGGVTAIGDEFSYGAARVFDGVHTYNTAGSMADMSLDALSKWASGTYASWVELADHAGRISTITLIPGYDDTKIRTPGLATERHDGQSYRIQWEHAIDADPDWVVITSFNEWHEGSEIEPSAEDGRQYLDLTAEYAKRFKAAPRTVHAAAGQAMTPEEAQHLRQALKGVRIAVLPDAESMAFWWLLDQGADVTLLTWEDVAAGKVTPAAYPMLLYCSGERYRRSVHTNGDVDEALAAYLKTGGFLVFLPARPWPFYCDESGAVVNQSARFGLALRMGWERPPTAGFKFTQTGNALPHLPERIAFPESGDLRWRGFFAQNHKQCIPLLQLRNTQGDHFGDAIAYAEPKTGGRVLYVWFGLLQGPYAEQALYDVFVFTARRLTL